jgi:hypothetical protein
MLSIAIAIRAKLAIQRFVAAMVLLVGQFIQGKDSNSLVEELVYSKKMDLIIPCFKVGLHQKGFKFLMVLHQMDFVNLLHYLVMDLVARLQLVPDLLANYSIGCSSSYAFFSRSTFF